MENKNNKDQTKSTQTLYKTNPEFKKKHLEYCTTKVECECGKLVSRCNLALHKRTKVHQSFLDGGVSKSQNKTVKALIELKKLCQKKEGISIEEVNEEIEKMIEKLLI
jgi:hypothetical protein